MSHGTDILNRRPGTQYSLLCSLPCHTLDRLKPAFEQSLSLALPDRKQLHRRRDKARRSLIQKRADRVFLRPPGCCQHESKTHWHMPGSRACLDRRREVLEHRHVVLSVRRQPNHLPTHLAACSSGFATQLHRLQLSIGFQYNLQNSGDEPIMRQPGCNCLALSHPGCQQLDDKAREIVRCLHESPLHRRFQSRREGIAARRTKAIDESEALEQRKGFHTWPSAIS